MTARIQSFIATHPQEAPYVVMDLDVVEMQYKRMCESLPVASVYYAVKANPAAPILERLVSLGARFDVASFQEVAACIAAGADPDHICYGNTLKKERDIKAAFDAGVRLFAFDCLEELEKLSRAAPGARVYCRILVNRDGAGANWPLSRKFGCSPAMAHDLMVKAADMGLDPYGISFHVGSQQRETVHWGKAIADASLLFDALDAVGQRPRMLNIGGGFPVNYRDDAPQLSEFARYIESHLADSFSGAVPEIMVEPGRFIVAEAGVLVSEVVSVSTKDFGEELRWVYLDVGKFGGLAETIDEAIGYDIQAISNDGEMGPVVIAGPTCDSADTLYERTAYQLPLSLKAGDRVKVLAAGAYTTMYASQGFNGFPPPKEFFV